MTATRAWGFFVIHRVGNWCGAAPRGVGSLGPMPDRLSVAPDGLRVASHALADASHALAGTPTVPAADGHASSSGAGAVSAAVCAFSEAFAQRLSSRALSAERAAADYDDTDHQTGQGIRTAST